MSRIDIQSAMSSGQNLEVGDQIAVNGNPMWEGVVGIVIGASGEWITVDHTGAGTNPYPFHRSELRLIEKAGI